MIVLLDANVLCRLAQRGHPHHVAANNAIAQLRREQHELCLVPQVLYEYWAVVTRPESDNGLGMPTAEVATAIDLWVRVFNLREDEAGLLAQWIETARRYDVKSKSAHDARLVAAMFQHGLSHLLTFNVKDFRRYQGIQILDAQSFGEQQ